MSRHHRPRTRLFAIVRFDAWARDPEDQVAVVQVMRTENDARAEVDRLMALNGAKGSRYFWQPTRLFELGERPTNAEAE